VTEMVRLKIFRAVHFVSTGWFILCVGYVVVLALRQVGLDWWVIVSLSGHWMLTVLLLVSVYLFAIFRGIGSGHSLKAEHPLTSTDYYMVFYDISPFLGALGGALGFLGTDRVSQFAAGVSVGTLLTTFLVWVIVDPAVGFVESMLPASRRCRLGRVAEARALRVEREQQRQRLLAELLARDRQNRCAWERTLQPLAKELAEVLTHDTSDAREAESRVVALGARAWQTGGLDCMRQLHSMTLVECGHKDSGRRTSDYLSAWWDGIGSWRSNEGA